MPVHKPDELARLCHEVRQCQLCAGQLPLPPKPVFQLGHGAKILIAAQAPGLKAHDSGLPFNDASGDRLRRWLGIPREVFYDAEKIALLPMGLCYPGRGSSGDLPPRPECAPAWRTPLLAQLHNIKLTLIIGHYALNWHLPSRKTASLTETVRHWQDYWPELLPLPHPSPRNNIWLKKNPWFEETIIPQLQTRVAKILN